MAKRRKRRRRTPPNRPWLIVGSSAVAGAVGVLVGYRRRSASRASDDAGAVDAGSAGVRSLPAKARSALAAGQQKLTSAARRLRRKPDAADSDQVAAGSAEADTAHLPPA